MNILLIISCFFILSFLSLMAEENTQNHTYTVINGDELRTWIIKKKNMTVIDAHSKPYYDGKHIPTAQWLSYEVCDEKLQRTLPL